MLVGDKEGRHNFRDFQHCVLSLFPASLCHSDFFDFFTTALISQDFKANPASPSAKRRSAAKRRRSLFTLHKKNDLHHDASHPTRPHYTSKCRHSKVITRCLDQVLPLNSTVLSAARHHEHKETFDHHSSGSGFDPPPLQCIYSQ